MTSSGARTWFSALVMLLSAVGSCALKEHEALDESLRPAKWAQPIDAEGLPNFYRVAPGLYRGAQPTDEGFRTLKRLGIRTVVSLRSLHWDHEEADEAGLDYVHIYAKAYHPEIEDVVVFLKVATDRTQAPVFVHCRHGSDRTGTMVAAFRVVVQGWTREEAIREMTQGGFGFHPDFDDLVPFVRDLDVNEIRRQAGLAGR